MTIIVMGVAGSGKSTIGKILADRLSIPFYDADDFHSQASISKMSQGVPLTDEDRYPWLQTLSNLLQSHESTGAVLACSALKENYRSLLQQGLKERITWIYLEGSRQLLLERMKARKGHFMPEALLDSQLATLEKPSYAWCISIDKDPESILDEIMNRIHNDKISHS
jgi:carbohydrate kinase (thermoresistant glucokinase family)